MLQCPNSSPSSNVGGPWLHTFWVYAVFPAAYPLADDKQGEGGCWTKLPVQ